MLVLTRNEQEEIIIITNQYEDDPDKKEIIKIKVLKVTPTRVKLGFGIGKNVRVLRADLQEKK